MTQRSIPGLAAMSGASMGTLYDDARAGRCCARPRQAYQASFAGRPMSAGAGAAGRSGRSTFTRARKFKVPASPLPAIPR
eukprot:12208469-Alexandrium_andersonii.AAC.1